MNVDCLRNQLSDLPTVSEPAAKGFEGRGHSMQSDSIQHLAVKSVVARDHGHGVLLQYAVACPSSRPKPLTQSSPRSSRHLLIEIPDMGGESMALDSHHCDDTTKG